MRRDYFATVARLPTEAQIGFGGWAADYPSAAGFIPPILSCAAFVPKSPENENLAEFCDPALDAKMDRASSLQAQDHPRRRCSGRRSSVISSPRRRSCRRRTGGTSTSSPSCVGNYQYNPQWGVLLSQLWVK